jgi:phosphopantetheinyl transferase
VISVRNGDFAIRQNPRSVRESTLDVSLAAMPYLIDHCLFRQPDDWPWPEDGFPVLPATTTLHHMLAEAAAASPGRVPTAVRNVRFDRWVLAAPPQQVRIITTLDESGEYHVRFGDCASARVELADDYPPAATPWQFSASSEQPPEITAKDFYAQRTVFHGPAYQGITEMLAAGDGHARAIVTVGAAPGMVLDNVGHVLVCAFRASGYRYDGMIPVGIRHLRFFADHPAPGDELEFRVRMTAVTGREVVADAQILQDGAVWAQIEGWTAWRSATDERMLEFLKYPGSNCIPLRQPGGWVALFGTGATRTSRDLLARSELGAAGYAEYERTSPTDRGRWLADRLAAKDAVRTALWDEGTAEVYPTELRIDLATNGRPLAMDVRGRGFGDFSVSIAHQGEATVAIARRRADGGQPDGPGAGVDIAEMTEPDDGRVALAMSEAEQAILHALGASDRTYWFAVIQAAKAAAAKAHGTGSGNLARFEVLEVTRDRALVDGEGQRYDVQHCTIKNPDDLPKREYVVAWTSGPRVAESP